MPIQGPSRDEGEIEFTAEELAEMQVDVATKEDAGPNRRKKRALRVPADEVPRQAVPESALRTVETPESDSVVERAFSNGGTAESKVKKPPKFTADDVAAKPKARQYAKTIPVPTIHDDDDELEISVTGGQEEKKPAKLPPNVRALMRALSPVAAPSSNDIEQLDSAELETETEDHPDDRTEEQQALPPREMIPEPVMHPVREATTQPSPLHLDEASDDAELTIEHPAVEAHHEPEEVDVDEVTEDVDEEPKRPSPPAMPDAAARARSITPLVTPAFIQPATAPLQPPPPPQAPALAAPAEELRPRRRRRVKQWFEEIFDDDYLRTLPYLSARQTERESSFVAESLGLDQGAAVLDVACGYGRHAMELAGRGYQVTGIDLSLPLLIRAADAARRIGVAVNFVHGDMREMTFDQEFDGAYCTFTSFGYFDDDTNRKVAANLQRALKPGGRVLIELVNRDYITRDLPTRVWWQGEGCVVLEEVDFNYFSSRLQVQRSIIFEDGRQLEQEISIRAYSLHEIGKVLHHAGFRVIEVSGGLSLRGKFFGAHSRQLLVLAEKKSG